VPSDKAGFATFVFIGPPGGLQRMGISRLRKERAWIVIVPTAWAPKNSQH
jgi:hypothetical protein